MEDRRSIAKKAAIGVALVIAAAGAVLFYKNNIAMNPGDTLLKYMSYAEDGKYEKMYDLLNEESQKSISKEEFIKRNKNNGVIPIYAISMIFFDKICTVIIGNNSSICLHFYVICHGC